ncbi:hypothetical protein PoB_006102300 [Plakobranchus ocellatus]|uniref:Uncharacterized protein n=1 Tax=Plakobranchus ocellatus TaxID=259542 RepID=A0AAV4CRP3_9GAST|nr:hypothetical protein PoB_006102300 [Plakobranchus ocellatus]
MVFSSEEGKKAGKRQRLMRQDVTASANIHNLEIRYDLTANRTVFFDHYLQATCSVFADRSYTVAWELSSGGGSYSIPPNDPRVQATVDFAFNANKCWRHVVSTLQIAANQAIGRRNTLHCLVVKKHYASQKCRQGNVICSDINFYTSFDTRKPNIRIEFHDTSILHFGRPVDFKCSACLEISGNITWIIIDKSPINEQSVPLNDPRVTFSSALSALSAPRAPVPTVSYATILVLIQALLLQPMLQLKQLLVEAGFFSN